MTGWLAVLGAAAGVFTAPGYRLFCDLMTGWVLTPGRHTITRVLTLADTDGRRAHDAYHRFVRAGRWATARLWRVLTVHAVALTCPDGVVELLVDDTLAHKSGRTVAGAGSFRDAVRSTSKRVVYAWGLNVVVVCLRVESAVGRHPDRAAAQPAHPRQEEREEDHRAGRATRRARLSERDSRSEAGGEGVGRPRPSAHDGANHRDPNSTRRAAARIHRVTHDPDKRQ